MSDFTDLDALLGDLVPVLALRGIEVSHEPEHTWQVLETLHQVLGGDEGLRDHLVEHGLAPEQAAAVLERLAVRRRALNG